MPQRAAMTYQTCYGYVVQPHNTYTKTVQEMLKSVTNYQDIEFSEKYI